jgi:predicted peptidase
MKIKSARTAGLTALAWLCALTGFAADPVARGFQNRVLTDADGRQHKYVVFVPMKFEPGDKPPVLLFLHGSGERGDNGLDQIMVGLGPAIWKRKASFPFVTVLAQCEPAGNWQAGGADAQRALAMLEKTQEEFGTDLDRVYLTGLSMGGSGAWSLAIKDPGAWAAVVPMCSRGDLAQAQKLVAARLPIWNFCGDKDQAATVKANRDMHEALQKAGAGALAKYTEYPGIGHNCWDNAYGTEELYVWLLEQTRSRNQKQP